MSNSLPPSKFGAGYVYGRPTSSNQPNTPDAGGRSVPAAPTPPAEPVDYPVMSDESPARVAPPTTYPGAAPSPGYSAPTPSAAAQPMPLPQAPAYQPAVMAPAGAPGGGAAIAAGVLALVIGLYRAWQTYLYFTVVSFFGAFNGEYSSYTKGPQTYATITAIASLICTVALLVGAVMLFNRRSGGRKLITLGCLIAIADVIVTWIVVMQFMKGLSSYTSSLVGEYGSSSDSIFSAVMSEQGPSIAISIALGVGLPLLTMILALSGSTRRWCEAPPMGMPVAAYGTVQPVPPSWSRPNDQPWQQHYAPPEATPQQSAAPLAGWGVSSQPAPTDPHAEFHRQAAEHFGTGHAAAGHGAYSLQPSYAPRRPAGDGENFVTRLMDRGMRGELFPQPWFHKFRAESPDQFVYISYGAGVFVSIVLALIPSLFVNTVLSDLLWLAIGYLYLALGTKLAHQFLAYGICVVGVLVMLSRMWSAVSINFGMAQMFGATAEPVALVLLELLMNGAGAAFLVFVGVQVHRKMQQISGR